MAQQTEYTGRDVTFSFLVDGVNKVVSGVSITVSPSVDMVDVTNVDQTGTKAYHKTFKPGMESGTATATMNISPTSNDVALGAYGVLKWNPSSGTVLKKKCDATLSGVEWSGFSKDSKPQQVWNFTLDSTPEDDT